MATKKTTEVKLLTNKRVPSVYEMVVVFKPFLPDKVRSEADEKVDSILADAGGKLTAKDMWGKRYLAYEIQGHVEGYYVMYQFESPGNGIDPIKKYLNRHAEVLRYLILKKDIRDLSASKMKVKRSVSTQDIEDARKKSE